MIESNHCKVGGFHNEKACHYRLYPPIKSQSWFREPIDKLPKIAYSVFK